MSVLDLHVVAIRDSIVHALSSTVREPMHHRFQIFFAIVGLAIVAPRVTAQLSISTDEIRAAVERSLPLLEIASEGSANQRSCFTCHSQAMPVFAFSEALRRGIHISQRNLQRQIEHTRKHLARGRSSYENGKGQGGRVDTAGYALWTLEEGGHPADEVTKPVVQWLLKSQHQDGFWKRSSFRPPSEASNYTTTYLALRALNAYGIAEQASAIDEARASANKWLTKATPTETEDRVFRLLSLESSGADGALIQEAAQQLAGLQRNDGGWAQLDSMSSDAYATGTVLYALLYVGEFDVDDSSWLRGTQFLIDSQLDDGSWFVESRSKPFQPYYETGFPHRADQFISTSATAWATMALLKSLPEKTAPTIETLAGTRPLDWPESDLSLRMMQTAHTFVETQIARANKQRKPANDDQSPLMREQLRELLGVVDVRLPPRMEFFGDAHNPAIIFETDQYQVFQVRWPVFANVQGEGLLVKQRQKARGRIVIVPDADQFPEALLGLVASAESAPLALQLAENGFDLIVPAIVSRGPLPTQDQRLLKADYTSREWIYRQAFHMGRHVIGYDVQRVLAAVDWLRSGEDDVSPIGIVGYGEGGLIALHTAALDPRIQASLVSGYFDQSDSAWEEPIYRNIWSRLEHFGNAEVAALIAPRGVVIEHSKFPKVSGHKGELRTPVYKDLKSEFDKIPAREQFAELIVGPDETTTQVYSDAAVSSFVGRLGFEPLKPVTTRAPKDRRSESVAWMRERQARTTSQLETHVQSLVHDSEGVREEFFLKQALPEFSESGWTTQRRYPHADATGFVEASKTYRRKFHEEAMGRFDLPLLPPNARTRKVAETEAWRAYDVVLDVHEGLFAWGVLVVPKDLKPGQQRPVVVCQHGRNGVPRDTIDAENPAYNDFAGRLAEKGFITFAPHNLYRGEDRYRWLDRKANSIGCTLFSFIIPQHDATLRWLDSLPFVDGDRIAFYGLSYGGETAVRVPAVLEKYCLSICSGDFNQWTRKVAATNEPFSFMNTIEWEMPYWNLGNTFDYAEMAYLIFPRPFMVERGHHDRVGRDQWVAHEFAKVRWLYSQFAMTDRVEIEFFQGGHSINGEGTFEFLERLRTSATD